MRERLEIRAESRRITRIWRWISILSLKIFSVFFAIWFSQFALSYSQAAATDSFLRPESTVVLMAGLPGDLESESTYREQLQSWLQLLEGIRPKRVVVLTDSPESISRTGSMADNGSMSLFPSARSNFLAVASLTSVSTNPLVVIIWGHGGKQGNTPVFHVRGPRIT